MVRQRALLFERLEVTEAMRAFISYSMSDSEKLRTRLERVENDFIAIQKAFMGHTYFCADSRVLSGSLKTEQ